MRSAVIAFSLLGLLGLMITGIVRAQLGDGSPQLSQQQSTQNDAISKSQLIDVRTPEEFAEAHVEGAKNIPLAELEADAKSSISKDSPVIVYCRSGNRSAQAATLLENAGYSVTDLGALGNAAKQMNRNIEKE